MPNYNQTMSYMNAPSKRASTMTETIIPLHRFAPIGFP